MSAIAPRQTRRDRYDVAAPRSSLQSTSRHQCARTTVRAGRRRSQDRLSLRCRFVPIATLCRPSVRPSVCLFVVCRPSSVACWYTSQKKSTYARSAQSSLPVCAYCYSLSSVRPSVCLSVVCRPLSVACSVFAAGTFSRLDLLCG